MPHITRFDEAVMYSSMVGIVPKIDWLYEKNLKKRILTLMNIFKNYQGMGIRNNDFQITGKNSELHFALPFNPDGSVAEKCLYGTKYVGGGYYAVLYSASGNMDRLYVAVYEFVYGDVYDPKANRFVEKFDFDKMDDSAKKSIYDTFISNLEKLGLKYMTLKSDQL